MNSMGHYLNELARRTSGEQTNKLKINVIALFAIELRKKKCNNCYFVCQFYQTNLNMVDCRTHQLIVDGLKPLLNKPFVFIYKRKSTPRKF